MTKQQRVHIAPQAAIIQKPMPAPDTNGGKGGKTLIPGNLQQFTIEQLRGTGEKGRTLRELKILSINRAAPPYDRIIKPPFVMPKIKNG